MRPLPPIAAWPDGCQEGHRRPFPVCYTSPYKAHRHRDRSRIRMASKGQRGRRPASTPGGERLRALREAAGRTQLWVELEAELGTGYLQRLESGKGGQPGRATLGRILGALGAGYSERRGGVAPFRFFVAAS